MSCSFIEIHQEFLKQTISFTTCCSLFLNFKPSKSQADRLIILYILYSHYAHLPLDQNPFLDFFLSLLEKGTALERCCVECILEGSFCRIAHSTPLKVCNEGIEPLQELKKQKVQKLKLKVAKLIDDPTLVILKDTAVDLLSNAVMNRTLTLSEYEAISQEKLSDYPLWSYIAPHQLPRVIHYNQFLSLEITPLLLESDQKLEYFQAILNTSITSQSIETVHHILVHKKMILPQDSVHYYISSCIRSCDILEGVKKDKQVRQVAGLIHSLLKEKVISMADYFVEIQTFCVSFMRIKGVVQLFRLASIEARQTKQ